MAKYAFLSDEWIAAAKEIRAKYEGEGASAAVPHQVKMNLVVTDVPFGGGSIDAHMDTTSGGLELDLGHIDGSDLKVTLDYATAKSILVEGNPQAGMQAFMAGKIKVEGDMAKLMALQTVTPDPTTQKVAQELKDITE